MVRTWCFFAFWFQHVPQRRVRPSRPTNHWKNVNLFARCIFFFWLFLVVFFFLSFSVSLSLFFLNFSFFLFLFLYLSFSFFSLFFFSSLLVLSCLLLMCSSRLVSKLPLVNTLQGSVVCLKMTRQTQVSSVHVLKRLRWETRKEKNHFPSGNRFALFPTKMGKQFDVRSWMQKTKIMNWFQKNGSVNSICRYVVSKVSGFEHMCTIAFFLFWCKELPINDHVSSVFTLRTFLLYQFFEKYWYSVHVDIYRFCVASHCKVWSIKVRHKSSLVCVSVCFLENRVDIKTRFCACEVDCFFCECHRATPSGGANSRVHVFERKNSANDDVFNLFITMPVCWKN